MSSSAEWMERFRVMRTIYDTLPPGDRAILRRCRDASEVRLQGAFWRLVDDLPARRLDAAAVIACFPMAEQRRQSGTVFELGAHLNHHLHKVTGRGFDASSTLRFRRLMQSRDRDELVHHLRALLRLCAAPVDWGAIGRDILQFDSDNPHVQRRWAEHYYLGRRAAPQTDSPTSTEGSPL